MNRDEKIFRQKEGFVNAERVRAEKLTVRSENASARGDDTTAKRFATDAQHRLERATRVESNNKKP